MNTESQARIGRRSHSLVIVSIGLFLSMAGVEAPCLAGDLPPHMRLSLLTDPLRRAESTNVHFVFLGDSRSTATHQFGALVPALQHRLWMHYGKLGMTPIAPGGSLTPSGSPRGFGVMGVAGRFPQGIGDWATRIELYPPEVKRNLIRLGDAMTYGWMLWTDWDGSLLAEGLAVEPMRYFEPGDEVIAEFFLWVEPQLGSGIQTRVNVANVDVPNPNAGEIYPWVTHGVSPTGLGSNFLSYKQRITEHAEVEGDQVNIGLRLRGAPGRQIEVLGGRWISTVEAGGVAISAFSQLGYRAFHHLDRHAEESRALAIMQPDVLIIFLDANDIFASTGEVFRANLEEIIRRYRASAGAVARVLLMNGFPVTGLHPAFQDRYQNEFPAIMRSMAEDDPHTAWINGWALYADREDIAPDYIESFHLNVGVDLHTFADRLAALMLSAISEPGD